MLPETCCVFQKWYYCLVIFHYQYFYSEQVVNRVHTTADGIMLH